MPGHGHRRHSAGPVFENRGAEVGIEPHPHGQLYATGHVTANARRVMQSQPGDVHAGSGWCTRASGRWRAAVPYCARLPYEIWMTPDHLMASERLTDDDLNDVADLLGRSYRALDAFFGRTTPLNLLWYSAPKGVDQWQLHAVIQPALRARTS